MPEIHRHWLKPDFGLRVTLPWLPQVRALIENQQPLAVQQWLLDFQLKQLSRHKSCDEFSFETVVIYTLHWQLLFAWGESTPPQAITRLQQLLSETLTRYQPESAVIDASNSTAETAVKADITVPITAPITTPVNNALTEPSGQQEN